MIRHKLLFISIACFLLTACDGKPLIDVGAPGIAKSVSVQVHKWKMVTTWPANFPVFQEGAVKFANDVRLMSNGRLDIQVYAGGELVPALQVFDAVSQGIVEVGHGSPYYWAGVVPAAQFFPVCRLV